MNKRFYALLIAVVIESSTALSVNAQCGDIKFEENSDLRIFTTSHTIKDVFASNNDTLDNLLVNSALSKIQRQINENDINLIASVVQAESNGEPFEGKVGVASVILNRLQHPDFPKSVTEIIYQKNAFSCIVKGYINANPNTEAYKAVNEALYGNDPTSNAIYFYNPVTASSKWMKNMSKKETIVIGNHIFFK